MWYFWGLGFNNVDEFFSSFFRVWSSQKKVYLQSKLWFILCLLVHPNSDWLNYSDPTSHRNLNLPSSILTVRRGAHFLPVTRWTLCGNRATLGCSHSKAVYLPRTSCILGSHALGAPSLGSSIPATVWFIKFKSIDHFPCYQRHAK